MAAKVALVSGAREAHGLGPSLRAAGLSRSTWYYHTRTRVAYAQKYAHLEAPLKAIAEAHPEYGYRRTTAELRETYGYRVNRKVVARLHRLWDLPLRRTVTRPKPSAVRRAIDAAGPHANLLSRRPKAEIGPLEVFYTDFTELLYADGTRKAWLIPILDHRTKYVPGFAVGASANSDLALSARTVAERTLARLRSSLGGVVVHHDRDPVFTGYAWTGRLLSAGARLSYALRGPRDNPEMESFFGRFKVENRSLILDAGSLEELAAVVRDRIRYYNRVRRHSSLGDRPPLTIIEDFYREG
ncbi:integrase core domain-containing protein [Candidatus Palauibacter sp.]|uniref:integrase core domain-containing protein n=1 Tax=Candidatus Palauibacter sp. TaxID=3101350 RepID=UPI003CC54FAF